MLSSSTLLFSRPGGALALLRSGADSPLCRKPLRRCTEGASRGRERTRRSRLASSSIVASAAAAANGGDETKQRDPKVLRTLLAKAVSKENYKEASRLKAELEAADPSILLQLQLEEAVKEERYSVAAGLKAQLDALRPPPPPKFEPGPTTSDTVTDGIRVSVKSYFVASQSVAGSTFTFAYRIKISNETADKTFQLLSRAWEIVDGGDGSERNPQRTERVRGPGVVGETPVLGPGQAFSYSSFAQLRTPAGSMRGTYTFVEVEKEEEMEEEEEASEEEEEEGAAGDENDEKKKPPVQLSGRRVKPRQQRAQRRETQNPRAKPLGPEFDVVIGQFGLDERDSRPPEPGTM